MNHYLMVLLFAAAITTATARMMGNIAKEEGENGSSSRKSALVQSDHDVQHKQKRVFQVIIPLAELSFAVLQNVLDILGNIERKIAIGIGNDSGFTWKKSSVYFQSGTSDEVLPFSLQDKKAVLYNAKKTKGSLRGAVGVICYYIPAEKKSVCFLFSVPFDYNLYSNWWNVYLYPGKKEASYGVYKDLYYNHNPLRGNDKWYERSLGNGYQFRGYMSSSGTPKMIVRVRKS